MFAARHLSRRLPLSAPRGTPVKAYAYSAHAYAVVGPTSSSPSLPSRRTYADSASSLREGGYDHILVERRFPGDDNDADDGVVVVGGGVGVITLHRPRALNALCDALFEDLIHAARALDDDGEIGCIVITGSGKAFAAGERKKRVRVPFFIII
jgi:hypothetical protein